MNAFFPTLASLLLLGAGCAHQTNRIASPGEAGIGVAQVDPNTPHKADDGGTDDEGEDERK